MPPVFSNYLCRYSFTYLISSISSLSYSLREIRANTIMPNTAINTYNITFNIFSFFVNIMVNYH